jgi:hypothetical protein
VYLGVMNYGSATSPWSWEIYQRPAGGTEFKQVHHGTDSGHVEIDYLNSIAVNTNGDAYGIASKLETITLSGGKTTQRARWNVFKQDGSMGTFNVADTLPAGDTATAITASPHGIYVTARRMITSKSGVRTDHWVVRKSLSGAPGSWTTVDIYQHDAANNLATRPTAVTVDAAGNVYVAGEGYKKVRTGGTDRKPIYSTIKFAWVRKSADGGASWTTDEVDSTTTIDSIDTDSAGNVYVAGGLGGNPWGCVRMKAASAAAWTTIDQPGVVTGVTVGSDDNVYISGTTGNPMYGFVRMQPALSVPVTGTFSSVPLSLDADAEDDEELLVSI